MQYNAMQCNAMQYNTIQYNTIQYYIKSFIGRLEVHINTMDENKAYITLTHTHTTIIKYVNIR